MKDGSEVIFFRYSQTALQCLMRCTGLLVENDGGVFKGLFFLYIYILLQFLFIPDSRGMWRAALGFVRACLQQSRAAWLGAVLAVLPAHPIPGQQQHGAVGSTELHSPGKLLCPRLSGFLSLSLCFIPVSKHRFCTKWHSLQSLNLIPAGLQIDKPLPDY